MGSPSIDPFAPEGAKGLRAIGFSPPGGGTVGSSGGMESSGACSTALPVPDDESSAVGAETSAGASVGSDVFSEDGSASYQYVRCVITSKVSNTGDTVMDVLDVNVGEVEISTWEFR